MRTQNKSSQAPSYGPHGDGAEIAYSIVDSALGRLIVAGTRRGICFAAMGESDRTLAAELHGRLSASVDSYRRSKSTRRFTDSVLGRSAHEIHRGTLADTDTADGYSRDSISVPGVGAAPRDSGGRDALVLRDRATHRAAARDPRSRYRQWCKSGIDRHPVPSRDSSVGSSRRISMGIGPQAQVVGNGSSDVRAT